MKRISAFVIALFMLAAQLPIAVSAEINGNVDGSIAAFHQLEDGIETQTVSTGTELSELNLPDTLLASIYHVDGEMSTTSNETVPVTWNSKPAYDENKAGTYVFSASPEGYTLSENAQLPMIKVKTTDKSQHTKTITDWSFVATDYSDYSENELVMAGVSIDKQVAFNAVVSMLPTQLSVHIENESNISTVDITDWECVEYKQDVQDNWPVSGEYIFTAKLQEGFECEPLPSIKVIIVGITTYANNTIEQEGLKVAASNGGEVEYTAGSGFLLKSNGNYEISGTWTGELEADYKNPKAVITVPDGVIANVTLNGLTINVSDIDYAGAFTVSANGTANITLFGENTLTSGEGRAGLEVSENSIVTISGDGSLIATGGTGGAGIGGGSDGNGGTIKISGGTITATGGDLGAGIGGGGGGHSGDITINGTAQIKAVGGFSIQVAYYYISDNGTISIGGNANVSAEGGDRGAAGIGGGSIQSGSGIGGGAGAGDGCTVEIFGIGTMVTASGGTPGYDVGSGSGDKGGSLSVTDGATLEMTTKGTNAANPNYKSCTIIDNNKVSIHYDETGAILVETPKIINQPQNQTTLIGNSVTLSVDASVSDGGKLSYEWYPELLIKDITL